MAAWRIEPTDGNGFRYVVTADGKRLRVRPLVKEGADSVQIRRTVERLRRIGLPPHTIAELLGAGRMKRKPAPKRSKADVEAENILLRSQLGVAKADLQDWLNESLTATEVAELLGLRPDEVSRLIDAGTLKAYRRGPKFRRDGSIGGWRETHIGMRSLLAFMQQTGLAIEPEISAG